MSVREAIDLFAKGFQVLAQRIAGKYPGVRFIAAPYGDEGSTCLALADPRNPEAISGVVISGVLSKFKISEQDFKSAYNDFQKTKSDWRPAATPTRSTGAR